MKNQPKIEKCVLCNETGIWRGEKCPCIASRFVKITENKTGHWWIRQCVHKFLRKESKEDVTITAIEHMDDTEVNWSCGSRWDWKWTHNPICPTCGKEDTSRPRPKYPLIREYLELQTWGLMLCPHCKNEYWAEYNKEEDGYRMTLEDPIECFASSAVERCDDEEDDDPGHWRTRR